MGTTASPEAVKLVLRASGTRQAKLTTRLNASLLNGQVKGSFGGNGQQSMRFDRHLQLKHPTEEHEFVDKAPDENRKQNRLDGTIERSNQTGRIKRRGLRFFDSKSNFLSSAQEP